MSGVRRRPWCITELEKAERLRAQGLSWRDVGERLGRPYHILEVQFCRWKKGKWGSRQPKKMRIERMVELVEQGWTARQVADHFQITMNNACVSLARRGYDGEVRRMYREQPLEARP